MLLRFAAALTALAAASCAPTRAPPPGPPPAATRASVPEYPQRQPLADAAAPPDAAIHPRSDADAGTPLPRRASSTCPESSSWNGKLCRGAGFDACPAGMHMEGDACLAADAPAPPRKPPARKPSRDKPEPAPEPEDDADDDSSSVMGSGTGVSSCDRFLQRYAACNALPAQTKDVLDGLARAWRTVGRDPRQRAAMQTACAQMEHTLRSACP